jgi:hypothetical protein
MTAKFQSFFKIYLPIMMIFFCHQSFADKFELGQFTIQFYRLKVNDKILVQNISRKEHFYLVEGITKDNNALLELSENILKSHFFSKFNIIDSIVKLEGKSFKLFLKMKNTHIEKKKPWVSFAPSSYQKASSTQKIEGLCFPNNRRISIYGDIKNFAYCRKGKWSLTISTLAKKQTFIFAQISNLRGDIFFDATTLINESFSNQAD